MIKNIETDKNIFSAEVSGMITKEDVESVIPMVEELIENYGRIKCLIILNEVQGYTVGGFLADFNFYFKHVANFDYMAMVGDKEHSGPMETLFEYLMPNKAKYFGLDELEQAKEWLKQA